MLIKIIILTISYLLTAFVNHRLKLPLAAYCKAHLFRQVANKAKEMFRKKSAMKKLKN